MKNVLCFFGIVLLCIGGLFPLNAQTPTPYNGTPPTFMTFDASYVKCKHATNWGGCNSTQMRWENPGNNEANWTWSNSNDTYNNAVTGVLTPSSPNLNMANFSHRFITAASNDPCMCYTVNNGATYVTEPRLPSGGWDQDPGTTDDNIDTVIQIGGPNSQGTGSQSIEYWFKPDTNNSVLLVMFNFAQEKADHPTYGNPFFYIEVMDENYNLLDLGYYSKTNGIPMSNAAAAYYWPYSRFLIVPIPQNPYSGTSLPYCLATPTGYDYYGTNAQYGTFTKWECPYAQYHNQIPESHSGMICEWFAYTPIAFNLKKQAQLHQTVIFRVKVHACEASYHWAYGYFAAKMIPGNIVVDACGGDEIILSVPAGFKADKYEWFAGADSASASYKADYSGMRTLTFDLTNTATRVYPYYRCTMESMSGVPFTYEANINFYDLEPDFNFEQIYGECNYKVQFRDNSIIRTRKPAATAGGTEDTVYQQTNFIQWFTVRNGNAVRFATNELEPVKEFADYNAGDTIKVMIVIEDSMHTCSDTITKSLVLDASAIAPAAGVDTVFTCEENLPVIYDQATFGETYTWNDAGTRSVVYEGAAWNGCDSTVNVTLVVQAPRAEIAVGADFCDAFTTNLEVTTNVDVAEYLWSTEEKTPTIEVAEPGTYSVTITDEGGCLSTATVVIPACKPFINLPNTITPSDRNGLNDCFFIPQKSLIKSLEFSVYNRFGELVYFTTDKNFEWCGDVKGKFFANVTYSYVLKVVDYDDYATMYKGTLIVL